MEEVSIMDMTYISGLDGNGSLVQLRTQGGRMMCCLVIRTIVTYHIMADRMHELEVVFFQVSPSTAFTFLLMPVLPVGLLVEESKSFMIITGNTAWLTC
jgi:hypothetical protein